MFDVLQYSFIQNAFIASTFVAIIAAIVGYFLLVRGLTFAGHALSHIGFAGAAGAVLLGLDPVYGLLLFTVIAGIGIGMLGRVLRERDVAIAIFLTLALAFGILFLFLYKGYAEQAYSILFGTILGISTRDVFITAFFSLVTFCLLLFLFRPLLFASFDSEVAEARGVPIKLLSIIFLIIVAVTVSVSVQVVGVLLVFTLLVGPAATAMRIVKNPYLAIGTAILLGISYSWVGIFIAAQTNLPVSFFIATLSFGTYILVRLSEPLLQGVQKHYVATI
jgi:zinc/manganese transport system permease protein